MRRVLGTIALITIGALAAPTGAAAESGGFTGDPAKEAEFVAKINQLRESKGLATLTVHPELTAKARDWSLTMAEAGEIWHSNLPDGVTADWQRLGENVGMGGTVEALHQAFIDSPGHYKNLVDPGFRHVGLGVTMDAEGTIFVSEVFMELASQPAPAASSPAAGTPSSQPEDPADSGSDGEQAQAASAPAPVVDTADADDADPSARLTSVLSRLRALDH